MSNLHLTLLILAMALVTFLPRAIPALLVGRLRFGARTEKFLRLIPYTAMELTTVVAEALRMCRLENAPENFYLPLSALRIGNVALLGIPGEPFTEVGVGIKEAEGFDMIMPCSLTNGDDGYFPVQSAYDEGGYETRTSPYRAGVAETFIKEGKALLDELRK